MTPLTASGWLWLGWCVFALLYALASCLDWADDEIDGGVLADRWLNAVLSIAWLCWLVAP